VTYCVRERIAPTRWNRAAPLDVEVTVMRVLWAVLAVAAVGCSSALPNAVASPSVSRVIEPTSTARTSASGTDEVSWTELAARPLQLPAVTAGARCPTSSTRPIPGTAPGAGGGPVYAVGTNPLPIDPRGAKVLFTAAPEYKAPALIRGRRLDGPEVIRFTSNGSAVWEELRFRLTLASPASTRSSDGGTYRPMYSSRLRGAMRTRSTESASRRPSCSKRTNSPVAGPPVGLQAARA